MKLSGADFITLRACEAAAARGMAYKPAPAHGGNTARLADNGLIDRLPAGGFGPNERGREALARHTREKRHG